MVAPRFRTRSKKRVSVRTPGANTITRFKTKKNNKASCGRCGSPLGGMGSTNPQVNKNLSKTQRMPTRPHAGVLCTKCSKTLFKYVTRFEAKYNADGYGDLPLQRDLTIEKYLPSGWFKKLTEGKTDVTEPVLDYAQQISRSQSQTAVEEGTSDASDEVPPTQESEQVSEQEPGVEQEAHQTEEAEEPSKYQPDVKITLRDLTGLGPKAQAELTSQGIKSLKELLDSDAKQLSENVTASEKKISGWQQEAKKLLEL